VRDYFRACRSSHVGAIVLALAGWTALSCGGGGGGGDDGPSFRCQDSAVAADAAALRCGQIRSTGVRVLRLVLGGPTSSSDIMGFNLDVVFDSTVLEYVAGSASGGTLLNQDGDDPLLAAALSGSDPGRLIVGIHRTNQPAGVQGAGTENWVLEFCLRASMMTKFDPSLVKIENAEAVDSLGQPIAGIAFSDQLLLSVQ
jgi:hypothetical protein